MSSATANLRAQIILQDPVFDYFACLTRSDIAKSYGKFYFFFQGALVLVWRLHHFIITPIVLKCLYILTNTCCSLDVGRVASDGDEVVSPGFDLHFPDGW